MARVAQGTEQGRPKPRVGGSNPSVGAEKIFWPPKVGRWSGMIDVRIHVQGVDHPETIVGYIEERVGRLDRFNERVTSAKFELRAVHRRSGGDQWVAQFTVSTPGRILRAEMRDRDQRHAVDVAVEKMRKQMRRYHSRKIRRTRRDAVNLGQLAADHMQEAEQQEFAPEPLVRTKRFEFLPMDVEEAIEQMEMLEHDFFVFRHRDTGETQVVYRRIDGAYGRIAPA